MTTDDTGADKSLDAKVSEDDAGASRTEDEMTTVTLYVAVVSDSDSFMKPGSNLQHAQTEWSGDSDDYDNIGEPMNTVFSEASTVET